DGPRGELRLDGIGAGAGGGHSRRADPGWVGTGVAGFSSARVLVHRCGGSGVHAMSPRPQRSFTGSSDPSSDASDGSSVSDHVWSVEEIAGYSKCLSKAVRTDESRRHHDRVTLDRRQRGLTETDPLPLGGIKLSFA